MAAAAGARKALAEECPASCIGALLAMLLQQVSSHCCVTFLSEAAYLTFFMSFKSVLICLTHALAYKRMLLALSAVQTPSVQVTV